MTSVSVDSDTGRLIEVSWIDSGLSIHAGWMNRERMLAEHMMVDKAMTVGYWVGENDDVLAIAQTRSSADDYLNLQVILKSCITGRKWLS